MAKLARPRSGEPQARSRAVATRIMGDETGGRRAAWSTQDADTRSDSVVALVLGMHGLLRDRHPPDPRHGPVVTRFGMVGSNTRPPEAVPARAKSPAPSRSPSRPAITWSCWSDDARRLGSCASPTPELSRSGRLQARQTATHTAEDLTDHAVQLGRVARQLAAGDPLPTPARAVERLRRITPPAMPELVDARLVQLRMSARSSASGPVDPRSAMSVITRCPFSVRAGRHCPDNAHIVVS